MGRCWVLLWLVLPLWATADVFFARMTQVADGDTLWVRPQGSQTPRKLRLQGLDAPEICQAGGSASRDALQRLLAQQTLLVTVNHHDSYGRGLALVRLEDMDVGALMVALV